MRPILSVQRVCCVLVDETVLITMKIGSASDGDPIRRFDDGTYRVWLIKQNALPAAVSNSPDSGASKTARVPLDMVQS